MEKQNYPIIPPTATQQVIEQTAEQQKKQQEQIQQQEQQKSTTEKVVETVAPVATAVKEEVVPTVHASDSKKDKGSSNDGRGSPKIVQADNSWVRNVREAEREQDKRKAVEDAPCDIQ